MTTPPISDRLPIALRAYAALPPSDSKAPRPPNRKPRGNISPQWTLVFDTETKADAAQALRFGTYQVWHRGRLYEVGIFHAGTLAPDELAILKSYADSHGLRLISHAVFIEEIFYGVGYDLHATIVGFNLPFDISRIAIGHGPARGRMRGGFTFKLSPHTWSPRNRARPNVQVKHISRRSAFIQFVSAGQPQSGAGQSKKRRLPMRRGSFIDLRTLAGALYARSFSLKALGDFLRVTHPKLDFDEFRGPITDAMIGYAVRDVQTTWECYVEAIGRYRSFGLKTAGPNRIYSEAGIGKTYLKDMGIQPWWTMQPDFLPPLLGRIMGSYFGGRSEVRIRREVRQVMLCDFLSMYPTVCILMGLWRFVIAKGMTWRDSSEETRSLLADIEWGALQHRPAWQGLATLVRVKPAGDIFPVRAAYDGEQTTIGVNHLTSDTPTWFTLADCIASKLLTGQAPEVVEAISFEAGEVQDNLAPVRVGGNPDYEVDPTGQDFYRAVIAMRQSVKARMKLATDDAERSALDIEQFALKIAANATSYGIFMEVNVEKLDKAVEVYVHPSSGDAFAFATKRAETPGTYFHPLLGTLITGAARLMLAITERLIEDAGLDWAFCDTDSMAIAKPEAMDNDAFHARVRAIVQWFAPLNPYGDGSILKVEEVNERPKSNEPEPLYVWAISAKRYALFNLDGDGKPVIRKASAHGLGHLIAPYGTDDPSPDIPLPSDDLATIGVEHWQHDLWWTILSAALAGHPDQVEHSYHPTLGLPAIGRYSATTPELLRWFKRYNQGLPHYEQVRPFNFLSGLSVKPFLPEDRIVSAPRRGRPKARPVVKPIAAFDRDPMTVAAHAFDRETGLPVDPAHLRSYADALRLYHLHPEAKFQNGDFIDRGTTARRHIHVQGIRHIGKESADWERQAIFALDIDRNPDYGSSTGNLAEIAKRVTAFARKVGVVKAAKALGITRNALKSIVDSPIGGYALSTLSVASLRIDTAERLIDRLAQDRNAEIQRLIAMRDELGLREAARRLGVDPSNLRRKIGNRR